MENDIKKYYWLKLKKDFFKRHDIRIVENMQNGKDYILFYLKLLCESTSHEGKLRFSDTIPYNESMLSTITNTNVDIVKQAVNVFRELGMITILDDGTLYMSEVEKMIGCETEWAKKKREYREKQQKDNLETKKDNVRQEIEKELEIELEIEKEIEKDINNNTLSVKNEKYQFFIDKYNEICSNLPKATKLNTSRINAIKLRLKDYTQEDILQAFQIANESEFCQGINDRNWKADFDFIMGSNASGVRGGGSNNIAKILEGKYSKRLSKGEINMQQAIVSMKGEMYDANRIEQHN